MDINDQILTTILTYGAVALGVILLAAAVGVPFPSSVVVIACGAFVEQGYLELLPTLLISLLFVVSGDTLSYSMGYFGRRLTHRWTQSPAWKRAEKYFQQKGSSAVFLTRCLLTPLAVPTNLIAGGSHFPFLRFVTLSVSGEFTWLISYGALGYVFGSQWEYISDFVSNFSGVLVGVVLLTIGLRWLYRNSKKAQGLVYEPEIPPTEEKFSSL